MSKFTDAVIAAAQSSQKSWGVPASVTLAQFALESAYGTRMPPNSFNPFGIKAKPGEPSVVSMTVDIVHNQPFRKYNSFAEAFDAHGKLLATVGLYAPAMKAWKVDHNLDLGVRLMAQHYATDPNYAAKILSIIHAQGLDQYDHLQPVAPAPTAAPVVIAPAKSNWLASLIELLLSLLPKKAA